MPNFALIRPNRPFFESNQASNPPPKGWRWDEVAITKQYNNPRKQRGIQKLADMKNASFPPVEPKAMWLIPFAFAPSNRYACLTRRE
jgi:hypothetical protein